MVIASKPKVDSKLNQPSCQVLGTNKPGAFSLSQNTSMADVPALGLVVRHIKDREISKIVRLKDDILIVRKLNITFPHRRGLRGKIIGLSKASRRRLLLQARNITGIITECTLTYPSEFTSDGRMVKRDVRSMLKWLSRRGLSGMWFLEFQERGAPHFHIFLTGHVDKVEVLKAWYRIVGSGDLKHLRAGTRIAKIKKPYALAAYAAKYAAKWSQKIVPDGYTDVGRFWSRFGGIQVLGEVIAHGSIEDIAPVVRIIRRLYAANRKAWKRNTEHHFRKFHDKGRYSFIAWGCARAIDKNNIRLIYEGGEIDNEQYSG